MKIADRPYAEYRGLSVDLARHWHPIEIVKQAVVLAHWYKIGYLQLHLTDHESWTFPIDGVSEACHARPALHARRTPRSGVVRGRARGDDRPLARNARPQPALLVSALPTVVGDDPLVPATGAICPGRESTYKVADTLVGEVCDVFRSTPYYHIGGDEVDKSAWTKCKYCTDYRKQHGIENDEELYRHFLVRIERDRQEARQAHDRVGRIQGGRQNPVPKDVTVMEFESFYEMPQNYTAAGYKVINTAWQPLYVVNDRKWSPEKILSWNMYHWENWVSYSAAYGKGIDVPPTPLVIGAQMCSWEQEANIEIPSLRQRLAAMSERRLGSQDAPHVCRLLGAIAEHRRQTYEIAAGGASGALRSRE